MLDNLIGTVFPGHETLKIVLPNAQFDTTKLFTNTLIFSHHILIAPNLHRTINIMSKESQLTLIVGTLMMLLVYPAV